MALGLLAVVFAQTDLKAAQVSLSRVNGPAFVGFAALFLLSQQPETMAEVRAEVERAAPGRPPLRRHSCSRATTTTSTSGTPA